jgi:phosphohistidine phosphatase SixA
VRLYLVRHADAAPGEPDALRRLSRKGRHQARDLGTRLVAEGAAGATVLTSPLLRARETGELVARALGTESRADERLAPGATAEGVREAVTENDGAVVAIGHQPDCGRVAAELTGGPEPPFPTAGLVVIELTGVGTG